MMIKIQEGLYAFLWENNQENNCNAFLITGEHNLLIDPGYRRFFEHVERGLATLGLSPEQIDVVVATHGHPDHLEAAAEFRAPTLFLLGQEEHRYFTSLASPSFPIPEPDILLQEGALNVGEVRLEIMVTPGHSPGSLCLYWPERKALFSGDVAFAQGIGTSELAGGDGALLKESLIRIGRLEVETLLPGHGGLVTGQEAVRRNFQEIESYWFNYL